VTDPAAWSRTIHFGVVEKVQERMIYVRVNPEQAQRTALGIQMVEFVR
jgi:uncharacterized membrane protein